MEKSAKINFVFTFTPQEEDILQAREDMVAVFGAKTMDIARVTVTLGQNKWGTQQLFYRVRRKRLYPLYALLAKAWAWLKG